MDLNPNERPAGEEATKPGWKRPFPARAPSMVPPTNTISAVFVFTLGLFFSVLGNEMIRAQEGAAAQEETSNQIWGNVILDVPK